MIDSLQQLLSAGPLQALGATVVLLAFYLLTALLPALGVLYIFYFLLTLPMRRNERARMFIDLLELGLKEGRAPEAALAAASSCRDRSLGARFHLLAAHLEQGLKLSDALDRVPHLLSPQIRAMLKTGERIGDIAKVLPACRQLLKDGVSHVRGALNYLLILTFLVTPLTILIPLVLRVKVLPKFQEIFNDMLPGESLPPFTRLVFAGSGLLTFLQLAVVVFLLLALLGYLRGPGWRWTRRILPFGCSDWISYRLPWRRKRLQRDFSSMLAILLDAEVPESDALTLAADATANSVMRSRAARVRQLLKNGLDLPTAIQVMDDTGEFHWRLSNALRRGSGFLRALAGWHQALDAQAFQSEQAAAQVATTAVVLFNGFVVACFVIAVFVALIRLINNGVLW